MKVRLFILEKEYPLSPPLGTYYIIVYSGMRNSIKCVSEGVYKTYSSEGEDKGWKSYKQINREYWLNIGILNGDFKEWWKEISEDYLDYHELLLWKNQMIEQYYNK